MLFEIDLNQLGATADGGLQLEPLTIEQHNEYFRETILSEETTIEQHRGMFMRLLQSEAEIKAEFKKWKVKELRGRWYGLDRMTKPELIDWRFRHMMEAYTIPVGLVATPGEVFHSGEWAQWYERKVSALTAEDMTAYREMRAEQQREAEARAAHLEKSFTNPETKEEFETFCRYKGEKNLTPEQLARYDEIRGRKAIERRTEELIKKSTVTQVELGNVSWQIVKGYHTKKLCDVWIVTLSDKVERSLFNELNMKAKQLGGWYGSKWGKNPGGFYFKDEGQANKFYSLREGDQSKLDRMLARRDRVRDNAVEHFETLADRMDERADDELAKDRKVNTARRVGLAEDAIEGARDDKRMAGTLRNHAAALAERMAVHLDRIRWRTHAETLEYLLRRHEHKVEAIKYPWPCVNKTTLRDIIRKLDGVSGFTMTARRVRRIANANDQPGEWGITFGSHHAAKLLIELHTGVRRYCGRHDAERLQHALADYKRVFKLMKLESLPELRAAIREHLGRRAELPAETESLRLVRALIGQGLIRGFVPTPRDVTELMLVHADPRPGMKMLEPQIGAAHLAEVVREIHPDVSILGIEVSDPLATIAKRKGFEVVVKDFLKVNREPRFDLIMSNPPFHNWQDTEHIVHEYQFLEPRGRLVSIINEQVFHSSERQATEFRAWFNDVGGEDFELPEGAFLESEVPTDWEARIVVIDREAA